MEVSAVFILILVVGVLLARSLGRATRWKRAQGTVSSSEIRQVPGSPEAWVPVVTFRYRLEGRDYSMSTDAMHQGSTGSPSRFNPWSIPRSRESALAATASFRPGAECSVYYDASDPTRAMLSAVATSGPAVRLALIAALTAILIGGAVAFFLASSGR